MGLHAYTKLYFDAIILPKICTFYPLENIIYEDILHTASTLQIFFHKTTAIPLQNT